MSTSALTMGERRFTQNLSRRIVLTFAFIFAGILFVFTASLLPSDKIKPMLWSMAALMVVIGIGIWFVLSRIELRIDETGLRYNSLFGNKELFWEQIAETRYSVKVVGAVDLGLLSLALHAFWPDLGRAHNAVLLVRGIDGKSIKLTSGFRDSGEAMRLILGRVNPPILKDALGRLSRGEAVPFGPVTLTSNELLWRGKSIAPIDLEQAEIVGTKLRIRQKDKWLSFVSVTSEQIPNVFVLLEAIRQFAPQLNNGIDPIARVPL